MLINSFSKLRSNYFKLICLVLFSITFSQYLISPQTKYYKLLKWESFNSKEIIIPKVCPIYNQFISSNQLIDYYYSNSITNKILQHELYPEFSYNNINKSKIKVYGQAVLKFNEKIQLQNAYEFDNNGEHDNNYLGIKRESGNGWVGYLQHSSINYSYINGHISLGRGNPFYYNMNQSLLLNPSFPPSEYIWWKHKKDWFQFDWSILLLNKIDNYNRFITFHRYEINRKYWRIGLSEAILGSYESLGTSELGYMMPAAVHIETEENRGINVNLMWVLDAMIKWNGWTYYGELLIDDFALDGLSPPQIGWSVGVGKKIKNSYINMEFVHINRWVGNYCNIENENSSNYIHNWIELDVPIGHSIGSDAQQLILNSYIPINNKLFIEHSILYHRHSDKESIERLKEWPENVPCETNFGIHEPLPTLKYNRYSSIINLNYLFNNNVLMNFGMTNEMNHEALLSVTVTYRYNNY